MLAATDRGALGTVMVGLGRRAVVVVAEDLVGMVCVGEVGRGEMETDVVVAEADAAVVEVVDVGAEVEVVDVLAGGTSDGAVGAVPVMTSWGLSELANAQIEPPRPIARTAATPASSNRRLLGGAVLDAKAGTSSSRESAVA